jgi:mediator of RNA polymerase II transcription subunit 5
MLAIHVKVCDIIFRALHFLEQYDYETVGRDWILPIDLAYIDISSISSGDPQTAVTHLGDVVLFVQYTIARFHVCIKSKVFY